MRWYNRKVSKLLRKKHDERTIVIFLWFRKNIDGDVRMWEKAWVRQRVCEVASDSYGISTKLVWKDVKWTTEKDEFLEQL